MDDHERQRRKRRCHPGLTGALVAGALTGLLAAGCSSGGGGPSVASLGGHTSRSGGAPSLAQSDQSFVSFARCMRSHGVQMSDPYHRPGHQGLSLNLPTRDAATRTAYAACIHFIQSVIAAKEAGAAARAAPHLPQLTDYARCMRGHDIPMLDPRPDGTLSLGSIPGISSEFGRYSPQFRAADTACRHLLPRGVHDDGTGP